MRWLATRAEGAGDATVDVVEVAEAVVVTLAPTLPQWGEVDAGDHLLQVTLSASEARPFQYDREGQATQEFSASLKGRSI